MFSFFRKPPRAYHEGFLPEQDGHRIFYHQFGNPAGVPVLCFHGGPGSFSKVRHTRSFDLKRHRVILFDQRGCGRSTAADALAYNTLTHLVDDARRLLDLLAIDACSIYGGSWGATVALAFAQTYPARVKKLAVSMVFLARARDVQWVSEESARFYPDFYAPIEADVPTGKPLREHYHALMMAGDDSAAIHATALYGRYEHLIGTLAPALPLEPPTEEHKNSFRIYMHYDRMGYGLRENQILADCPQLANIPVLIVHNRLDMICPVEQAWRLHQALPASRLVIVPELGHGGTLLDQTLRHEIKSFFN